MKIVTNKQPVFGTVMEESRDFGMKFDEKAYTILSSGLYKFKIRAFIRELSCNAIDGHIALEKIGGTPPKYFDVELPSDINLQWRLRDYGIGMDKDGIFNLFTTYFASTKEDSDDFIGAFGLGSKSPFCYTTTFTVTSWCKGLKTVYSIFMNNGIPKCVPIFEEPSDEPTGIEIVIPIDQDDITEVRNEARVVYHTFDKEGFYPNIINQNFELTNYKSSGYYGSIMDNGVYAVMGGVSYKIPAKLYENEVCSVFFNKSYSFIDFPVGSLNPLPNREELSLDKHTLNTLNSYFKSQSDQVIDEVNKKVSEHGKDARSKIHAILSMDFGEHIFNKVSKTIDHNGKSLQDWRFFYESITSSKEWSLFKDFCVDYSYKNKNFVYIDTFSNAVRNVWNLERARYYGSSRKIEFNDYFMPSVKNKRYPFPILLSNMDGKWKVRIKLLMKYGIIPNERVVVMSDYPYSRKPFKNVTRNLFIQIAKRYHKDDIDVFHVEKLYDKHVQEIEEKEAEEKRQRRLEAQRNRAKTPRHKPDNSHYYNNKGHRSTDNFLAKDVHELSGLYGLRSGEYIVVDGHEVTDGLQSWLSEMFDTTLYAFPKTLERRANMNENLTLITKEMIKGKLVEYLNNNLKGNKIGWNINRSDKPRVDMEITREMKDYFGISESGDWDHDLGNIYVHAQEYLTEHEYQVYTDVVENHRQSMYDVYHNFYDEMKKQFPMECAILRLKKNYSCVKNEEFELATKLIMENYKGV